MDHLIFARLVFLFYSVLVNSIFSPSFFLWHELCRRRQEAALAAAANLRQQQQQQQTALVTANGQLANGHLASSTTMPAPGGGGGTVAQGVTAGRPLGAQTAGNAPSPLSNRPREYCMHDHPGPGRAKDQILSEIYF